MSAAEMASVGRSKDRIQDIHDHSTETAKSISLIGYCCDIEGNLQYWENYLAISMVLRREGGTIVLRDGCHFVFGGDACDRGAGDLRVIADLTALQQRYPGRVHLIMGNRDINKLRMRFELCEYTLRNSLGNVYWAAKGMNNGHTATEKLNWMLLNTLGCPITFESRRQELADLSAVPRSDVGDDAVVQSFLDLVAPNGLLTKFLLGAKLGVTIGDTCFCHGALHASNLGKVPPSIHNMGRVCSPTEAPGICADLLTEPLTRLRTLEGWRQCSGSVQEWYDYLNAFANEEIQHYVEESEDYLQHMLTGQFSMPSPPSSPPTTPRLFKNLSYSSAHTVASTGYSVDGSEPDDFRSGGSYWALVGGYTHPQPGSRLLQYGMGWLPDKEKNPSIVYENWLNEMGEPAIPNSCVSEYLRRSGIRFVVTGHQPHGDAPLVMVTNDIVYVAADTSYSANVKWEEEGPIQPFSAPEDSIGEPASSPAYKCSPRDSFVPDYDSVIDSGVTRGVSVSEVCFEMEGERTAFAFSHGVLSSGMQYIFPLQHGGSKDSVAVSESLFCNQDLDQEWWIKGFVLSPPPKSHNASVADKSVHAVNKTAYLASKSAKFSVVNKLFRQSYIPSKDDSSSTK